VATLTTKPHRKLLRIVARRVSDGAILKLIRFDEGRDWVRKLTTTVRLMPLSESRLLYSPAPGTSHSSFFIQQLRDSDPPAHHNCLTVEPNRDWRAASNCGTAGLESLTPLGRVLHSAFQPGSFSVQADCCSQLISPR
jgi:hypothetical protein